jgi:hypothetical protein
MVTSRAILVSFFVGAVVTVGSSVAAPAEAANAEMIQQHTNGMIIYLYIITFVTSSNSVDRSF